MTQLVISTQSLFDSIKRVDEYGTEYWTARELQTAINYSRWNDFVPCLNKANAVLFNIGVDPTDHIRSIPLMVEIGSGASREVEDYKLTRLGAYLLTINCDYRKPTVASAQLYFAVSTIKAEILNNNSTQTETETKLFSDSNYELSKKIGESALELARENNQYRVRIAELEARLAKLEAPALLPSDGINIKALLRCCGIAIDSTDGNLFQRLAYDLKKAVETGALPKTAIASSRRYRFTPEVQNFITAWMRR